MPRFRRTGARLLDIEIYLDVLESIHATAGGEGVKILFRVLSCHSEGSELPVSTQFPQPLMAACPALQTGRHFYP